MVKQTTVYDVVLLIQLGGERITTWESYGWIGVQRDNLLKLFTIEFLLSFPLNQELFILSNLGLETFLRTDRLLEHAEEVNRVIFMQALHLLE